MSKEVPEVSGQEKAAATLFTKVYVPNFVKAAADQGVAINTQEELRDALRIVDHMRVVKQAQAAQGGSLLKTAADRLDALAAQSAPAAGPDIAGILADTEVAEAARGAATV